MATLGDIIFRLRAKANKRQGDLALELRWAQSRLSRIETNALIPRSDDLDVLLSALGASDADRLEALKSFRRPGQR